MTFLEWNDALVRRFFNESNAGKRVFLAVDEDLVMELGGPTGKADFVTAVKTQSAGRICREARRARENWRNTGSAGIPPYVGYLALFVLAASTEGEYHNEGFQKRLHRLLGEEPTNVPPHGFYDMWELWEDLEIWANDDRKGILGVFICHLSGATPFVDQFCSQIVLTEGERIRLPQVFADAELDPGAPPASEELALTVARHGTGRLHAKTLRRLQRQGSVDEEFRTSTIEAILEELRSWSGAAESDGNRREYHILRINLNIVDRLSGRAESTFIAKDIDSMHEGDYRLESAAPGRCQYQLGDFQHGWSAPLRTLDGVPVDAAQSNWERGIVLSNNDQVWRVPGRRLRVFRKGEFHGVNGLLEVARLDPHQEFFVAADPLASDVAVEWGQRAAAGWTEIRLRSGLPRGWRLFHGTRANPAVRVPPEFPALHSDPQIRILLRGGIKLKSAGRRYFDFAPPTLQIEGLSPASEVFINGSPRPAPAGDVVIRISPGELHGAVKVQVLEGGEQRCSASFQMLGSQEISWKEQADAPGADCYGVLSSCEGACVRGPTIVGFEPPLLLNIENSADLVGAKVGQIVRIPAEKQPDEWNPVWIIERGRNNRRAGFCGSAPDACRPFRDGTFDRKKAREWKNVLWYDRKHLQGPKRGVLAALWAEYREVAKNV